MRSELAVPLISASGRLEGVLNMESTVANAFDERDKNVLQALATQAVIAIQEVMLLDALKEVTQLLLTQPSRVVFQRITELASELLNSAASALWVVDGDYLILEASCGDLDSAANVPLHDSLIGHAVLERTAIVSEDVRVDPRFRRPDIARDKGWARALIVPLAVGDQPPIGVISVFSLETSGGRLAESEWDKKILNILADYAALASLNADRQAALQRAHEQHMVAETFAALGDAAANLLHQLNNRIGVIPVRVEGIQDKSQPALQSDPYLAENLEQIGTSARDAMAIVRDNLNLLHPIDLGPFSIASCVAEAVQNAHLAPEVEVRVEALETLPMIVAGKQSLTLVFTNLLENAAHAMQGQGSVTIQGVEYGGWVEIDIRDTGPGISSQLHDQIFEFNFSGQAQAGKLGFGLWWIKTLMMRLGGSISVESDGEHGTTFRLRLPQHIEQQDYSIEAPS
jgi:signal transduction histidine kinase